MNSINHKLTFARLNTKFLKYFYDEKSLLCEELSKLDETLVPMSSIDPQGYISKIEKKFLKDKEIIDCIDEKEKLLSKEVASFLESAIITEYQNRTTISFDLDLTGTIYHSFGRGSKSRIENIHITKNTVFEIRNHFNSYENEKFIFSIMISENKAFALSVEPSNTGIKGDILLKVIELCDEKIILDNGDKYFEVKNLLRGISL